MPRKQLSHGPHKRQNGRDENTRRRAQSQPRQPKRERSRLVNNNFDPLVEQELRNPGPLLSSDDAGSSSPSFNGEQLGKAVLLIGTVILIANTVELTATLPLMAAAIATGDRQRHNKPAVTNNNPFASLLHYQQQNSQSVVTSSVAQAALDRPQPSASKTNLQEMALFDLYHTLLNVKIDSTALDYAVNTLKKEDGALFTILLSNPDKFQDYHAIFIDRLIEHAARTHDKILFRNLHDLAINIKDIHAIQNKYPETLPAIFITIESGYTSAKDLNKLHTLLSTLSTIMMEPVHHRRLLDLCFAVATPTDETSIPSPQQVDNFYSKIIRFNINYSEILRAQLSHPLSQHTIDMIDFAFRHVLPVAIEKWNESTINQITFSLLHALFKRNIVEHLDEQTLLSMIDALLVRLLRYPDTVKKEVASLIKSRNLPDTPETTNQLIQKITQGDHKGHLSRHFFTEKIAVLREIIAQKKSNTITFVLDQFITLPDYGNDYLSSIHLNRDGAHIGFSVFVEDGHFSKTLKSLYSRFLKRIFPEYDWPKAILELAKYMSEFGTQSEHFNLYYNILLNDVVAGDRLIRLKISTLTSARANSLIEARAALNNLVQHLSIMRYNEHPFTSAYIAHIRGLLSLCQYNHAVNVHLPEHTTESASVSFTDSTLNEPVIYYGSVIIEAVVLFIATTATAWAIRDFYRQVTVSRHARSVATPAPTPPEKTRKYKIPLIFSRHSNDSSSSSQETQKPREGMSLPSSTINNGHSSSSQPVKKTSPKRKGKSEAISATAALLDEYFSNTLKSQLQWEENETHFTTIIALENESSTHLELVGSFLGSELVAFFGANADQISYTLDNNQLTVSIDKPLTMPMAKKSTLDYQRLLHLAKCYYPVSMVLLFTNDNVAVQFSLPEALQQPSSYLLMDTLSQQLRGQENFGQYHRDDYTLTLNYKNLPIEPLSSTTFIMALLNQLTRHFAEGLSWQDNSDHFYLPLERNIYEMHSRKTNVSSIKIDRASLATMIIYSMQLELPPSISLFFMAKNGHYGIHLSKKMQAIDAVNCNVRSLNYHIELAILKTLSARYAPANVTLTSLNDDELILAINLDDYVPLDMSKDLSSFDLKNLICDDLTNHMTGTILRIDSIHISVAIPRQHLSNLPNFDITKNKKKQAIEKEDEEQKERQRREQTKKTILTKEAVRDDRVKQKIEAVTPKKNKAASAVSTYPDKNTFWEETRQKLDKHFSAARDFLIQLQNYPLSQHSSDNQKMIDDYTLYILLVTFLTELYEYNKLYPRIHLHSAPSTWCIVPGNESIMPARIRLLQCINEENWSQPLRRMVAALRDVNMDPNAKSGSFSPKAFFSNAENVQDTQFIQDKIIALLTAFSMHFNKERHVIPSLLSNSAQLALARAFIVGIAELYKILIHSRKSFHFPPKMYNVIKDIYILRGAIVHDPTSSNADAYLRRIESLIIKLKAVCNMHLQDENASSSRSSAEYTK